mmetsp:Transcript_6772/g.14863  ORF Transcript_6772/g.14863 Transcript_6772/m.14863 type:complete len:204 (+) Transcript_6772:711-1322(+)|eukprot:CAMPEP_0173359646 /NCGR_PEP_ID=MMETSP1144-20121109/20156_1 /TAXON_ID=483371 /ORGANISM="non described non described, Strain CCMP2298" /LENGTH=203 /DNA_ID=CAMNT_0014308929 /DNA_START=743 /DNA_END=1357 /DNA_ORIENTATION=-
MLHCDQMPSIRGYVERTAHLVALLVLLAAGAQYELCAPLLRAHDRIYHTVLGAASEQQEPLHVLHRGELHPHTEGVAAAEGHVAHLQVRVLGTGQQHVRRVTLAHQQVERGQHLCVSVQGQLQPRPGLVGGDWGSPRAPRGPWGGGPGRYLPRLSQAPFVLATATATAATAADAVADAPAHCPQSECVEQAAQGLPAHRAQWC